MSRKIAAVLGLAWLGSIASAQTPCYADNDGPNYNDGFSMGGVYVGIKFTTPASFLATRIEVFSGEATGASEVKLWSHDAAGNQPLSELGTGAFTLATNNSWQGANLVAPVSLVANQTYWFVWVSVNGAQSPLDVPMANLGQEYRPSFDNGQTWGSLFQFNNRHWKFRIFGTCTGGVSYCTAGTTTNGCVPAISGSGLPSASATSGFTVLCSGVEGQKSGIVFYGVSGRTASPWANGSSSTICVKAPSQRMGTQNSGGTLGACNGSLSVDWNAYRAAHAGALGSPFASGNLVNAQGWFRDPPAPKTTNLTDALELLLQP